MNLPFPVLICFVGLLEPLFSRTAEERTLSSLKYAIELYRAERNEVPKDWASMEKFGLKTTLDEAREMLDIENRYMFPNLQTIFYSGSFAGKRIVLMAKKAGDEGSLKIYENDTEFRVVDGRFVIFEKVDTGVIDSGRISEAKLKAQFHNEGLSLADFTFEAPPKPKAELKVYRPPDSIRRPGDPPALWEEPPPRATKQRGEFEPSGQVGGEYSNSVWRLIIAFGIACVAGILFFLS